MSISNSFLRRQILNQRFARQLAKQYRAQLQELLSRVADRIAIQPNSERLRGIQSDLKALLSGDLSSLAANITDDISAFAVDESAFVGKVISANSSIALRAPDTAAVLAALNASQLEVPFGPGRLSIAEALDQFSNGQINQVLKVVQDGFLLGDNPGSIADKIRALGNGRPRYQAEALARTLTNHASSSARKTFAMENAEVFDGEEWVATLDSRTTLICAGRDGEVFDIGKGPYPPAHWNCRSLRIPVLASEFEKASQKSNRRDFDSWLRDQSDEFQDEYFSQFPDGLQKAKLFRDGGLGIQQFRDEIGKAYTLDQLKGLNPIAFDQANLTDLATVPSLSITPSIDLDKAPTEVQKWFTKSFTTPVYNRVMAGIKTPGEKKDLRRGAYYQPWDKAINMGKATRDKAGRRETYRHEFGHHVDWTIDKGRRSNKADFKGAMADDKAILKGIEKELLNRYKVDGYKSRRRGFNAINEFREQAARDIYDTMDDITDFTDLDLWIADNIPENSTARLLLEGIVNRNKGNLDTVKTMVAKFKHAADMDSDLLSIQLIWDYGSAWRQIDDSTVGITGLLDNIFALVKNWGGGHPKSYYTRGMENENQEIFANTFAAMDAETSELALKLYQRFMPNLYKLMTEILENEP